MARQVVDLQVTREKLDQVDEKIVRLFEERLELSRDVAAYKMKTGKAVRDPGREREKIETLKKMVEEPFYKRGVEELFTQIMAIGRKLQYQMISESQGGERLPFVEVEELNTRGARILYQGIQGAYSHMAAMEFFGETANMEHVKTWEEAMNALTGGRADFAVLPIENSSAGMVADVYDLLYKYDNYIVGEVDLKVEHALLGLPGTRIEDIRTVYSHNQGLMQCSRFLGEHSDWRQVALENTAVSARKVKEDQDPTQAAIASLGAGKLYGLEVLKCPVNYNPSNTTRFVVVTNQKIYTAKASKVSICFEIAHESGSLYNILSHFIFNNLNMTKIESRPIPGHNWEYRFFVDFEGNLGEAGVKNAVRGISEEAASLKILGNY